MRRGDLVPRAFQAPVDVHASVDGQVYMFRNGQPNYSVGFSEEEEFNVMALRSWGRQEPDQDRLGSLMLLERDVLVGDNLNKLALQYGCKLTQL
uniref:LysM domain-containing protein n=1 Tax=Hucho hucho TaxID=62062 RepID=A0A4W5NCJ1_9TELE